MMDLLLEAALRSFGLGAAVWIGLRLVRVVNPRIELRVWVCVMLASDSTNWYCMPRVNERPSASGNSRLPRRRTLT